MKYSKEEHKWLVNLYIKNNLETVKKNKQKLTIKEIKKYFDQYNVEFSNDRKFNSFFYWCKNLEYLVFLNYFKMEFKAYEHVAKGLKIEFNKQIEIYENNKK